jgi:hypothetical protein
MENIKLTITNALRTIEACNENIKEYKEHIALCEEVIKLAQQKCKHDFEIDIDPIGGGCVATCKICNKVEVG